ncbi:Nucleoside-diphosphate-sugar epimerase [Pseudoxanthobacter soli DSM 19599]|uniref:Nucleoside-diphosphate-sugar epimerase n=1 Tax=Pseudoxanthobacter soli DSM 19599 TaxID=1123029 RepID=A0A1M7ZD22_9HYPH|nr:NAD(P)H-binding protein [Pseudoxanthobacter soli]SHO62821.1 Nucleoside-diphosphate-sugar epimerase [Pseudoxanthobacter soli DSM 19599]
MTQNANRQNADRTALVLGATGGIGGEVVRGLQARGWAVRALHRDPGRAAAPAGGIRWITGDAMNARDVAAAAEGAQLVVHAVNPPGYRRWAELVLPMIDNTIAAAVSSGARILLPGTVYNYGRDVMPLIGEDAPQNPFTNKGRIRAEMERRLKHAADAGGKVLIVRAGDYFGPRSGNNWFSQVLAKGEGPLRRITYPGRRGVGHQWAYLPDVAETMMRLVEREQVLGAFASFHMAGHWDADGTAMIAAIRRAVGRPDLPVSSLPWAMMALAAPFVPLFRELGEMRYLWREPVRLDGARLAALGIEAHTPLDAAVRETLAGRAASSSRAAASAQAATFASVAESGTPPK